MDKVPGDGDQWWQRVKTQGKRGGGCIREERNRVRSLWAFLKALRTTERRTSEGFCLFVHVSRHKRLQARSSVPGPYPSVPVILPYAYPRIAGRYSRSARRFEAKLKIRTREPRVL
jgi:hypothetical protein